jgi:hypothetical protein
VVKKPRAASMRKGHSTVRISWSKKALAVGTSVGVAVGTWIAVAPPAHAAGTVIAAEGADVTGPVMTSIFDGTGAINVQTPTQLGSKEVTVPADSFCNSVTYNSTGTGTDGSGNPKIIAAPAAQQGVDALNNSVLKTYPGGFAYTGVASSVGGCIDIARSSSLNKTPSSLENYAFAVDAVTWGSPSLDAPAFLSLQDLRDIWNCNLNDWSQVGGSPGPILRALPFFGSGTRKFFINNVLGISTETATTGWNPPTSGVIPAGHTGSGGAVTCPAAIGAGNNTGLGEQSNGANLSSPTFRADLQKYIIPYSAANWVQQANGSGNPTIDKRGGVRPGGIVGVAPTGTFPAAYAVRWTGTSWRLNDGQILGANETGGRSQAGVTAAAQFATALTGAPGTFVTTDVGLNVQGTFINDGTVITAVNGDGSQATISPGASAANTGAVTIGWAVVSEKNPNISGAGTGVGTQYPGVRDVYNIIRPDEPSYLEARNLIGFDDTASNGTVSALCNGSDAGTISDFGFLPLAALDPTGAGVGNDNAVTCRKQ